jgi:hypothetical protein
VSRLTEIALSLGLGLARAAGAASSSPPPTARTFPNAVDPVQPSARRVLAWGQNNECPVCRELVARPADGGLLEGHGDEPDRIAHVIPCFAVALSQRGHPMMTTALTRAQREGTT